MDELWWWLLIGAAGVLYLGLLVFALVEWVRHPRAHYLNRWVWLLIIVVFSLLGPASYLLFGRKPRSL
jgi:hypothetical protein